MDIEGVIKWVMANPSKYPGLHQTPQPRSTKQYKSLEPASLLQMVWNATVEYIHENLLAGKGVNLKGFGAFTLQIETDLPRTTRLNPAAGNYSEQREQRQHLHRNRPVFVPDPSFSYVLTRNKPEAELDKPKSQHSIFQKGFQMIFCNALPIANCCHLAKHVVHDSHNALFSAIKELTRLRHSLKIKFNFCVLIVQEASLRAHFNPSFLQVIQSKEYEKKMRKSDNSCSSTWKTTTEALWRQSVLSSLWGQPSTQEAVEAQQKTVQLKLMSQDLSSIAHK